MSEPTVWRKENTVSTPATPSMATYSDAMNKFTKAATSFMDHVHLLNEARDAYQVATSISASLRNNLDAGDRALRALMTQMEQVVNAHLGEASLDRKKPETMKVEAIRANGEGTVPGGKFLP